MEEELLEVNICGFLTILDEWELIRWIIIKTREGSQLTATAVYKGKRISGQLKPHSIYRTQLMLTMTCLIDLLTEEGTYILPCKYLKKIEVIHISTLEQ